MRGPWWQDAIVFGIGIAFILSALYVIGYALFAHKRPHGPR